MTDFIHSSLVAVGMFMCGFHGVPIADGHSLNILHFLLMYLISSHMQ